MTGPHPDHEALLRHLAQGFGIPPATLGVGEPEPATPTWRERAARHVGQAGWDLGNHLVHAADWAHDHAPRAADRITDLGDWLAHRIAGRR